MTVSVPNATWFSFAGDGSTDEFTFPLRFLADADLIIEADSVVVDPSDYTVTGAGAADGGAVTFDTAPAAAVVITIRRNTAAKQLIDLDNLTKSSSPAIDIQLDRFAMKDQDQDRDIRRAWKSPVGSVGGLIHQGAEGTVPVFDEHGDLVEGPDAEDIAEAQAYAALAQAYAALAEAAANRAGSAAKIVLTTDQDYYVRSDGLDSLARPGFPNDSAHAFATRQFAHDYLAAKVNLDGHKAIINCADGLWTDSLQADRMVDGQRSCAGVVFRGNVDHPENCIISVSTANLSCFKAGGDSGEFARFHVEGFELRTSGSAWDCLSSLNGGSAITFGTVGKNSIRFGQCARNHQDSHHSTYVKAIGPYTISGGGFSHAAALSGGKVVNYQVGVVIENAPNFTGAFSVCYDGSHYCSGIDWTNKEAVTGIKYATGYGGRCIALAAVDYLPGDVPGVSYGTSEYVTNSPGGLSVTQGGTGATNFGMNALLKVQGTDPMVQTYTDATNNLLIGDNNDILQISPEAIPQSITGTHAGGFTVVEKSSPATGAANDVIDRSYQLKNSDGNNYIGAVARVVQDDATAGSEDVSFTWSPMVAGVLKSDAVRLRAGLLVGNPTGGDKGTGTLNLAGDIYKNNTAYTNPDYVFEHYFTGSIVKFAGNDGAASYTGLMPIAAMEAYARDNLRLPGISDEPAGMFERGDTVLQLLEQAFLYIFELEKRLAAIEPKAS